MSCFECKKSTESCNLFICLRHLPTENAGKLGYPISPQTIFCSRCLLLKHWDCHSQGNAIKPRSLLEYMNENAIVELEEELEIMEHRVQQMLTQFRYIQNMLKEKRALLFENKTVYDCTKTNLMNINSSLTVINSQLQDTLEVCEAEDKLKPIIAKQHSQVEEPKPVEQKEENEPISLKPPFSAPQTSHAAPDPKKTFSLLRIMHEMKLSEQAVAEKSEVASPDKRPHIFNEMLALGETQKLEDVEQIQEGWKTIIYDPPSTGPVTKHVDPDLGALSFVQRSKVDELYEGSTLVELQEFQFAGAMHDQMKFSWAPGSNT